MKPESPKCTYPSGCGYRRGDECAATDSVCEWLEGDGKKSPCPIWIEWLLIGLALLASWGMIVALVAGRE